MNVSLTPELEKMIHDKVASGMYNNASEVVREGLRLLVQKEKPQYATYEDYIRGEVMKGIEAADRGELKPLSEIDFDDIVNRAIERHRQKNQKR